MKHPHSNRHKYRENHFWQSYSDLMAALLFIFVLALVGTILRLDLQTKEIIDRANAAESTAESIAAVLDGKNEELERILGIRRSIIEALRKQFSGDDLTIDYQTGSIIFNSDLFFPNDEFILSREGKDSLVGFLPRYLGILLSEEYIPYIAEIRIEGHTDDNSGYMYNLRLSQDRALNVSEFILENRHGLLDPDQLALLQTLVTACGRSESDLIYNADGTVNRKASRRVEIQFQLKDEEMIKQMIEAIS